MRTPGRVLLAVGLSLALAGCGGAPATVSAPSPAAATPAPVAAATGAALPTAVTIPAIGAHSSLEQLGLNPDGTVQVPSLTTPLQAGWYRGGSRPGDPGPAVLLGHVDSHGVAGIFYRLREVKTGDQVLVARADGSTATFVVTRTETVPKSTFPTTAVYGPTPGPTLRLITCGGQLDAAHHNYLSSVIVFAALAT